MIHEIHIQNYAVIDDLTVDFYPGLNLLSGETGSGKSIVVDALGLALGGRAAADAIRTGCDRATVTAVFRSPAQPVWDKWREELGLEETNGEEILFRRVIQSNGRSRLLLNDQPVTASAVRALADLLVEVHGQNEQVTLFSQEAQLELLDRFTRAGELVGQVAELYGRRRQIETELESLNQNEQDRLRMIDLLGFQLRELDQAQLELGEDSRLEEEKHVLAHREKVLSAVSTIYGALYDDENSACERVGVAGRALDDLRAYDSSFDAHVSLLRDAKAQLEDLAMTLRDYAKDLDANPSRLEEIEDRLAILDRIKRKYGKTIEEAITYREKVRLQLSGFEHSDERREELTSELKQVAAKFRGAAEQLSQRRREAAASLEKLVRKELAALSMEKSRFAVHFEIAATDAAHTGGPKGIDAIEFRISPNPGEDLRPLGRIASGGELSRIMLALKTVLGTERPGRENGANKTYCPTFIFDEVDTGVGGRVAESVGQRLKRLSQTAQVICVTHLAQIACFADHHYYVEKFERGGRSHTSIRHLEGEKERAKELARMLSGRQVTDAVLKHAATMLKQASA
ncbi:MAG: DNA repair protein RecN [Acidobacteria bacterium]|nr:MAG: DNA repair protein RecN [Acidobacteriota bacterium]